MDGQVDRETQEKDDRVDKTGQSLIGWRTEASKL
jgi:hypothetical protein